MMDMMDMMDPFSSSSCTSPPLLASTRSNPRRFFFASFFFVSHFFFFFVCVCFMCLETMAGDDHTHSLIVIIFRLGLGGLLSSTARLYSTDSSSQQTAQAIKTASNLLLLLLSIFQMSNQNGNSFNSESDYPPTPTHTHTHTHTQLSQTIGKNKQTNNSNKKTTAEAIIIRRTAIIRAIIPVNPS